jgi:hypothetical protein
VNSGVVHTPKLCSDRLQQLDGPAACLDVVVVIVTLLFDTVESFLVNILAMSYESRILRCPGRMRCPFIIENLIAQLVATAAYFLTLSLREQAVTWAQTSAIAECHSSWWNSRFVLDEDVTFIVSNPV